MHEAQTRLRGKQNGDHVVSNGQPRHERLESRDTEKGFVGIKILGTDLEANYIDSDDFFHDDLRDLNNLVDEFITNGGTPAKDTIPFAEFLKDRGEFDRLKHTFLDCIKYGQVIWDLPEYGRRLRELRIRRDMTVGLERAFKCDTFDDKKVATEAVFAHIEALKVSRDDWRFKPKTPWQLSTAEQETDFLVDWLLVAGQPLVIGGPSKSHKTSIMVDLAISIAAADSFLGYWPVSKSRKVLCFSGESGEATLAETFKRVCTAKGINPTRIDNLLVETEQLPDITTSTGITELTSFIKHTEAEVVIVDPVYLAMNITAENSRSVFEMGAKLRKLNEAVRAAGATLIVLHHLRKANQHNKSSPPGLEDLTGSGFAEFARQWLLVRPREEYDADFGIQRLWLNVGGSSGYGAACCIDITEGRHTDPGGRVWEVDRLSMEEVKVAKKERREAKYDDLRAERKRKLLDAFQQAGFQGDTLRAACNSAGLNPTRMKQELEDFADELQPCKVFKGGKAYEGFRIAPKDVEDQDMLVFEAGGT